MPICSLPRKNHSASFLAISEKHLQNVAPNEFLLTQAFCKKRKTEAGRALSGCLGRPPCKLRPSTVLASSVQIACSEHADCLPEARKMLVRNAQKPCYALPKRQPPPSKWLSEAAKRAFFYLGSPIFLSFKCKDFAIRLPCRRLRQSASVFPHKPGGRPEKTDSHASGKPKCQNVK